MNKMLIERRASVWSAVTCHRFLASSPNRTPNSGDKSHALQVLARRFAGLRTTCGLGLVSIAASFLTGCASPEPRSTPVARTVDTVADGKAAIDRAPSKDKVLIEYRTALEAMRKQRFAEAKPLLDDALLTLGGIAGTDKNARKSRSYFNEESKKTFIGEPYERVMAYYYRGILYWMDGEPDNARACFRSAEIQDADAEKKEYAADYSLLDYLDGLATTKLAGDGSDAYKRAVAESKLEQPPAYDTKANALFFIEFGKGPTKYATGQYREQLRFRDNGSVVKYAMINVAGQSIRARPYDDLYFQATTRGGRVMDHVLANKAIFKTTTGAVGDAAIISGAVLAGTQQGRHNAGDEVGLGLLAFGVVNKIVSGVTTPAADTRSWDNLPQYLSFAAAQLPSGQHTVTVDFYTEGGARVVNLQKTVTINVVAPDKDIVVFVSDR
jgi:hypothetical protein